MTTKELVQYVVPILVVGIVLLFRFRRMRRSQPLDLRKIWIVPAILLVVAGVTIATHPPSPTGIAMCVVALVVGGAIGWHRGKLMRIEVDPASSTLRQTASPAAMLLLVAIIAVRSVARAYFGAGNGGEMDEATLLVTDVLLLFAVGLIGMTRLEMGLRGRRLLAEHRNAL